MSDERTIEARIYERLSKVIDPELGRSVTDLGMIAAIDATPVAGETNTYDVRVRVELTVEGCPLSQTITNQINGAVASYPDATLIPSIEVGSMSQDKLTQLVAGLKAERKQNPFNKPGIKTRIFAIASGKGGGVRSRAASAALARAALLAIGCLSLALILLRHQILVYRTDAHKRVCLPVAKLLYAGGKAAVGQHALLTKLFKQQVEMRAQPHAQIRLLRGHHLGRIAQRHHHIGVRPHAGHFKQRAQQRAQVGGGGQIIAEQAQAHLGKIERIGRGGGQHAHRVGKAVSCGGQHIVGRRPAFGAALRRLYPYLVASLFIQVHAQANGVYLPLQRSIAACAQQRSRRQYQA